MAYMYDEESVEELINSFFLNWNDRDQDALDSLMEEDVTMIIVDNHRFDGKEDVRNALAQPLEHNLKVCSIEFKAFHPDIVLAEVLCEVGNQVKRTLSLVVTCGPDEWQIEWLRFGAPTGA